MKKLKVGLIGFGFMGKMHLDNYVKLEKEGFPVELKAILDVDGDKFTGKQAKAGNIKVEGDGMDLSGYSCYTDFEKMLDEQQLDAVDITVPTHLHAKLSNLAMNKGLHVFCEKPMALNSSECAEMVETATRTGLRLMIGQCLRFWPAYEYAKNAIDSSALGQVNSAYFFRGSATPDWSYQNWLMEGSRSGGCLLDMHVHDVDIVNWLFGKPLHVATAAKQVVSSFGYDIVSTNYHYGDGKVVNAQADWTFAGDFGFVMEYRINCERGSIRFDGTSVTVHEAGRPAYHPELSEEDGYYRELKYFYGCLLEGRAIVTADPVHIADTIRIVEAEQWSADRQGETVKVG